MAIYSIKDLEKLSGIKAHTIRIWEQRYGIITPRRTQTNIRYYQDEDLKLLLNIALLNKNGLKISKIAEMSKEEMAVKVGALSEVNFAHDTQLNALTIAMIEMEEAKFEKIIESNIEQLGFEKTIFEVIYPFLDKLGLLWLTGSINPVQENFISYLIRQKIIAQIDKLKLNTTSSASQVLIFLPQRENQELSILLLNYLLKARNYRVIYLGPNVSFSDLEDVRQIHQPHFIFTMITESYDREPAQKFVDRLSKLFDSSKILLSGYQVVAQNLESKGNVHILTSLEETIQMLDNLNMGSRNKG